MRRKTLTAVLVILWFMILWFGTGCVIGTSKTVGMSMTPTMKPNGSVAFYRFPWTTWERGDIVLAYSPDGHLVVKRIVGIPGDTIKYKDGSLLLNDNIVDNKTISGHYYSSIAGNWEGTLGENEYYVLGDNRDASRDSEDYGPVSEIWAKVWLTY